MSKVIALFLDGTNNDPNVSVTNVQRLYRVSKREGVDQITYYQPGVGTIRPDGTLLGLRRQFLMALDSATGWMIQHHVCAAYRFLMATWEPGDKIMVFGFSRGAFVGSVLCGMLRSVGLLHRGMDEMVAFAWDNYVTPMKQRGNTTRRQARDFLETFSRQLGVAFLGLWDCVDSIGTPFRRRMFNYANANLQIERVRQAIAIDERRAQFLPVEWDNSREDQVKQVWFAGAHSDIGGGYEDGNRGLGRISFAWMLREATEAGLRVDQLALQQLLPGAPDDPQALVADATEKCSTAFAHESLLWSWWIAEWIPTQYWILRDGVLKRKWGMHRGRRRVVPDGALLHKSVRVRIAELPQYGDNVRSISRTYVD